MSPASRATATAAFKRSSRSEAMSGARRLAALGGLRRRIGEELRLQPVLAAWRDRRALENGGHEGIDLTPVGFRIALEEERQSWLAKIPLRIGMGNRRGVLVAGRQQAGTAVDFDALVVAVRGAARIRDLRDLAGGRLEQDR